MLIVCTAKAPTGATTHHLVRAETGAGAHRRIRPLLSPGSHIDTVSLEHWLQTQGPLPQDLRPLDQVTQTERTAIEAAGGQLIPAATPPPGA